MTLDEVIAKHAAATTAKNLPSITYRAGGVLDADRWCDHARTVVRRNRTANRIEKQCLALAATARIYGTAAMVIDRARRSS